MDLLLWNLINDFPANIYINYEFNRLIFCLDMNMYEIFTQLVVTSYLVSILNESLAAIIARRKDHQY